MESGETFFSYLYKGRGTEDLYKMRYKMFAFVLQETYDIKISRRTTNVATSFDASKYQFVSVLANKRIEWKL